MTHTQADSMLSAQPEATNAGYLAVARGPEDPSEEEESEEVVVVEEEEDEEVVEEDKEEDVEEVTEDPTA
jgi:hypothetical protein